MEAIIQERAVHCQSTIDIGVVPHNSFMGIARAYAIVTPFIAILTSRPV